jgi:glycosyltransferase involved in cell wall biosynthesis
VDPAREILKTADLAQRGRNGSRARRVSTATARPPASPNVGKCHLRIAQIAPLAEAVPPKLYGGTERVIWWLTEALVDLGHDVTLYASADSETSARLEPCADQALRLAGINNHVAYTLAMVDRVRREADQYDVLHFHTDFLHFPLFREIAGRTFTTLHGRLDLPDFYPGFRAFPDMQLVSISDDQRAPMPDSNFVATVHHGLPESLIPFSPEGGDYLAFLGRMSPEKRPDRAIEIAIASGVPLKMAAKVDHADRAYFDDHIAPLLDHPLVEFIGEIGDADKPAFLGNARALLFPIDWPEPFGLVMIEAMAAGTPVIAWPTGSVREVIEHGKSGYIVDSVEGAVAAVTKAARLPRRTVRERFEARFTARRMALDYVALFESALRAEQTHGGAPFLLAG